MEFAPVPAKAVAGAITVGARAPIPAIAGRADSACLDAAPPKASRPAFGPAPAMRSEDAPPAPEVVPGALPGIVSGAAPDVVPGTVAMAPSEVLSPPTAMALPVALTGGAAGEVTWLPPAAEPEPVVVDPDDPAAGAAVVAPVDEPVLDESPSTATELPATLTGGAAGEVTWLPPAAEPEPVVVDPDPAAGAAVVAPVDEPVLDELPSTATELPVALTGAAGAATTWLPPATLCDPVVPSAADACPAKNRTPPPTMRVTSRPLRRYACMLDSSL
jgi:hypothetical protein